MPGTAAARVLLPTLVLAELCSWYAVRTRADLGRVIRDPLWILAAGCVIASLVALRPRDAAATRRRRATLALVGGNYILFLQHVDAPRYWARWLADEAAGRPCLPFRHCEDWQAEVAWTTHHFSVVVWLSIAMVDAPDLRARDRRGDPRSAKWRHGAALSHGSSKLLPCSTCPMR